MDKGDQREMPQLIIHAVPSDTQAFDLVVPDEWTLREALVEDSQSRPIVDVKDHDLHLVGYSVPVCCELSMNELRPHLSSLPEQPDAIPYVTSYFSRRLGPQSEIISPAWHFPCQDLCRFGSRKLHYGEILIPDKSEDEIFLSTYVCHPSIANNGLSGPMVTTPVVKWIMTRDDLSRKRWGRFAISEVVRENCTAGISGISA